MKTSNLIITVSGEDRPGIVGTIAELVHEHGGNWERSRLIHLAGRFVGLLQVSVPQDGLSPLKETLLAIEGLETTVAVGGDTADVPHPRFHLALIGADHPGIVREIFGCVARLGLNVEDLTTHTEAAADSGTLLFRAEATLSSDGQIDPIQVTEAIENLAHDLHVEVSLARPE